MVTSLTNTRMSIHMDWRGNVDSHDELQSCSFISCCTMNFYLYLLPFSNMEIESITMPPIGTAGLIIVWHQQNQKLKKKSKSGVVLHFCLFIYAFMLYLDNLI